MSCLVKRFQRDVETGWKVKNISLEALMLYLKRSMCVFGVIELKWSTTNLTNIASQTELRNRLFRVHMLVLSLSFSKMRRIVWERKIWKKKIDLRQSNLSTCYGLKHVKFLPTFFSPLLHSFWNRLLNWRMAPFTKIQLGKQVVKISLLQLKSNVQLNIVSHMGSHQFWFHDTQLKCKLNTSYVQ